MWPPFAFLPSRRARALALLPVATPTDAARDREGAHSVLGGGRGGLEPSTAPLSTGRASPHRSGGREGGRRRARARNDQPHGFSQSGSRGKPRRPMPGLVVLAPALALHHRQSGSPNRFPQRSAALSLVRVSVRQALRKRRAVTGNALPPRRNARRPSRPRLVLRASPLAVFHVHQPPLVSVTSSLP